MSVEIWKLDATAQAERVRRGEMQARELVELALARAEALAPKIGAVVGVDAQRALDRAEQPPDGPFAGVPWLVKDVLAQPGLRCAFGSRLFASHVPEAGTPYSAALEASGAITLGKSTSSEFGLLGSTETLLDGPTRNPWALGRSAGGSSGGSAAAVAAGIVPFAHANDAGGSIRIPAALCGLFGFKPSAGRCLRATPVSSPLTALVSDHCVSRSVRDSARLLAVTEDRSEGAAHRPIGAVQDPIRTSLRVAVVRRSLLGAPAPEVGAAALDRAAALCVELGHTLEEVSPTPPGSEISEAFFTSAGASVAEVFDMMAQMRGQAVGPHEVEPFTWELVAWYRSLPAGALERARAQIEGAGRDYAAFLAKYDVVMSPTVGVATPELGFLSPRLDRELLIRRTEQLAAYTPVHNLVGAPAMSVPLGWDPEGLPVGIHFAASPGEDARLLSLAYQLEDAAPWAQRWPAVALDGPVEERAG